MAELSGGLGGLSSSMMSQMNNSPMNVLNTMGNVGVPLGVVVPKLETMNGEQSQSHLSENSDDDGSGSGQNGMLGNTDNRVNVEMKPERRRQRAVRKAWTSEEEMQLKDAVEKYGKRWSLIAKALPNRTLDQCRERWRTHLDPRMSQFHPHCKPRRFSTKADRDSRSSPTVMCTVIPGLPPTLASGSRPCVQVPFYFVPHLRTGGSSGYQLTVTPTTLPSGAPTSPGGTPLAATEFTITGPDGVPLSPNSSARALAMAQVIAQQTTAQVQANAQVAGSDGAGQDPHSQEAQLQVSQILAAQAAQLAPQAQNGNAQAAAQLAAIQLAQQQVLQHTQVFQIQQQQQTPQQTLTREQQQALQILQQQAQQQQAQQQLSHQQLSQQQQAVQVLAAALPQGLQGLPPQLLANPAALEQLQQALAAQIDPNQQSGSNSGLPRLSEAAPSNLQSPNGMAAFVRVPMWNGQSQQGTAWASAPGGTMSVDGTMVVADYENNSGMMPVPSLDGEGEGVVPQCEGAEGMSVGEGVVSGNMTASSPAAQPSPSAMLAHQSPPMHPNDGNDGSGGRVEVGMMQHVPDDDDDVVVDDGDDNGEDCDGDGDGVVVDDGDPSGTG